RTNLIRVAMQIQVADEVVFVARPLQPNMCETIRTHEMAVIGWAAVKQIRSRRRPRRAQPDLVRSLARGVSPVKGKGRRIAGRIGHAIGAANMLQPWL